MKFGMQLKTLEKIVATGQKKKCRELLQWSKDIINHFWYSCSYASNVGSFMVCWFLLMQILESLHVICHIVIETLSPHFLKTEHMINYNAV